MRALLLTLLFFHSMAAQGFETILVNENYLNLSITEYSDYLSPTEEDLSILDVTKAGVARQFTPVHSDALKFNQLSDSTWLTFAVNNPTGRQVRLFLNIEAPFLTRAELYANLNDSTGYSLVATGAETAYQNRPFQMGRYVLPVTLDTGLQQLYLNIQPNLATNMQVHLLDENTLLAQNRQALVMRTLQTSILLAIIGVCLVAYLRYRIPLSLWTALTVTGFMINTVGWNGSITWLLSGIPFVEVIAINAGAFLMILGLSRILLLIRSESYSSWLSDALIWVGRLFMVLSLLALSPLASRFLPIQIILLPLSLTIFSL